MNNKSKLDRFQQLMFADLAEIDLEENDLRKLMRYRFAFTQLLENPSLSDTELRDVLMREYGIEKSQAYIDISNMKVILPNIRNAGKEWVRYIVNEELKQAIADAKTEGKLKERIMAIQALAKYNKLDQDEGEQIPWEKIIPQEIEPTSDPTVLGIKPLKNKHDVIKRLYAKYKQEIEIEDIEPQPTADGQEADLL